ncbi:ferredoxin reductase family protein [Desulfohalovibrio reitneri]|uniref:ferredoxin reductase family protein n=1 Tax=Desulfohalovibrio reitneri TaxID=1307759 RepID=UPI0004A70287|nr:ferric reductase-like transmembrane domain-containing protein [Desulfohalovibrio reitneri]
MRNYARSNRAVWLAALTALLVLAVWLTGKWLHQDWFDNPWKYPAKAASLTSTTLMCWALLLATRWRPLEHWLGGLDKVYRVHSKLGRWAFYIIPIHPFCLAMDRLPDGGAFLSVLLFRVPQGDRYLWGQNAGAVAFLLMALLVALTLWWRPAYHRWKKSHEFFGLVIGLAGLHVWLVDADVAAYPGLRWLFWGVLAVGLASFVSIRLLYPRFGPRYRYRVQHVDLIGDVLDITFAPKGRMMDFLPSQFVYLVVDKPGIPPEPHPYSIACGYNLQARFKLGIRMVGDYTSTLDALGKGDEVTVYGPYGRFSEPFLFDHRDCVFIAGGIGITPFLGMWHVALHSEEGLLDGQAPEILRRHHPELVRTWRCPRVSMFYVCRDAEQASFDKDIRREAVLSRFHGFRRLEERGHHYELYLSSEKGRFTAEYADSRVEGGLRGKLVFLCGPQDMMNAMIEQLKALGVPEGDIFFEDFSLV